MNRRFVLKSAFLAAGLAALAACEPTVSDGNVVQVAASGGNFTTLIAALTAADLADTLQGPGPFTIFAPSDAAFAALPAGTVENLLLPENKETLVALLTYHVVPGAVTAEQLSGERLMVATLNGSNLQIDGREEEVKVGPAVVTRADTIASNGVIHEIDRVLMR